MNFSACNSNDAQPHGSRQTVLVVDDEVLVRLNIADYLRGCGYHVFEAGSADEAISILRSERSIDIVFSDIQMPGELDGFGLARWVREHRPALKTILTSGYARAAEEAGELCRDNPLMPKPYLEDEVLRRIQAAIVWDRPPG